MTETKALGLCSRVVLTAALLPSESEAHDLPNQDREVLVVPLPPVGIASQTEEPREAGSHQLTTAPGQTRVEEENDHLRHDSDEEMDGTWGGPDLVEVSIETHKLLTVACT